MRTLAAAVVLLALAVHAEPPQWTDLGAVEGRHVRLALNKLKALSKSRLTVPACIDIIDGDGSNAQSCATVDVDCSAWTLGGTLAGPGTMGDAIAKNVCPK